MTTGGDREQSKGEKQVTLRDKILIYTITVISLVWYSPVLAIATFQFLFRLNKQIEEDKKSQKHPDT